MNLLIEAIFFKFEFVTGIERHFSLQLEIFNHSNMFEQIYVVVKNLPPAHFLNINAKYKIILIQENTEKEWENIYKSYKFDLLYSTFEPPASLPPVNIPVLHVLHDPGRYLYPEHMEKGVLNVHMENFKKYIARKNFYIVTVSNTSKKDILKFFPTIGNKIFVIYNFISEHFVNTSKIENIQVENLEKDKFFLTVGIYMPTKNTLSIVKAFENRNKKFKDYFLVILGRQGWYKDFNYYLQQHTLKNILNLQYVEDNVVHWLYKNCYGLINASIYEGFGLPLIESAYLGCKRIFCSDIEVFKEIFPWATYFFNPFDINAIRDSIFNHKYGKQDFRSIVEQKFNSTAALKQFLSVIKVITKNEKTTQS